MLITATLVSACAQPPAPPETVPEGRIILRADRVLDGLGAVMTNPLPLGDTS